MHAAAGHQRIGQLQPGVGADAHVADVEAVAGRVRVLHATEQLEAAAGHVERARDGDAPEHRATRKLDARARRGIESGAVVQAAARESQRTRDRARQATVAVNGHRQHGSAGAGLLGDDAPVEDGPATARAAEVAGDVDAPRGQHRHVAGPRAEVAGVPVQRAAQLDLGRLEDAARAGVQRHLARQVQRARANQAAAVPIKRLLHAQRALDVEHAVLQRQRLRRAAAGVEFDAAC